MSLKKTGVELVADGARSFQSDIERANKSVTDFGTNAERAGGGVSAFGTIATGALLKVGMAAVEMGIQGARAIAGFVSDSVSKAGDFESSMNEFAAVTGDALADSGKSLKDFSSLFIQMGRELPVSTADVQQAAIELAKGGIDPATIAAGGLRTSLDLAAAGGVGLADSANILAKQLGVWVDSAASADEKSAFLANTADLLSQAANVTTSDVSEMALGLANAGGTAKIAGLDYQELVQTMALVAPGFSSAADAGTSLKTFLSRLIPSTDKAAAAMIDLGLANADGTSKFYDSTGAFIGMEAAAGLLQKQTEGLSESQRLQAFQTIFGADAIRIAAMVAEQGADGYAAMGAQMDAAGSVAEQAKARQQGFNTAMENAKGSIEALQLTIGAYLLPVLSSLLNDYISPGINAVTTFADAFFASADKVGFLMTSLQVLGATIGAWITTQAPIWAAQVLQWGQAFVGWVTPMIPPLLASLGQIATTVGSWIVGQAPQWAAQLALWGMAFVSWITPYASQALTTLSTFATSIGAWIISQAPVWLAQLVSWGVAFAGWVAPMIPQVLATLGALASSLWGWIQQQAPVLLAQFAAWGQALVGWIAPQIPGLLAQARALAAQFLAWIGAQAAPILAKLGEWATSFVAWIVPATKDFLAKWPGMLEQFLAWIGTAAGPILAKLGDWTASFLAWVVAAIPPFLTAVAGIAAAILIWVGETAGILTRELVTKWIPAFIDWIATSLIPKLGPALQTVLDTIGTWIGTAATWVGKEVVSIGTSLVQGIEDGVASAWGRFIGWINGKIAMIPKAIRDFLGIHSPSRVMAEQVGKPIVQGIRLGIEDATPDLRWYLDNLGRAIPEWLAGGIADKQPLMGDALADGISQALKTMADRVQVDGRAVVSAMEDMAKKAGTAAAEAADDAYYSTKPINDRIPLRYLPANNGRYSGQPVESGTPLRYLPADDPNAVYSAKAAGTAGSTTFAKGWIEGLTTQQPAMLEQMTETLHVLSQESIQPWAEGLNERLELSAGFWMQSVADGISGSSAAIDAARGMGAAVASAFVAGLQSVSIPALSAGGGTVSPPASGQQILHQAAVSSVSNSFAWNGNMVLPPGTPQQHGDAVLDYMRSRGM